MKIFARFFEEVQQDLKAFGFWCCVLMLFRIAFIGIYSGQLNGNYSEVPLALLLGLRLSLKTAGFICLFGFVFASLPRVLYGGWSAEAVRKAWHGVALLFFSVCFMARIPYYKIFNAAFNMMLINGVHDDVEAILSTAVKEYQLLWRLPIALLLGFGLCRLFIYTQKRLPSLPFGALQNKRLAIIMTVLVLPGFCVFVRYGGAFRYADSINWESAARLSSNLLNEAILDDGQALYRVRASKKLMDQQNNIKLTADELRAKIQAIGGNAGADSFDEDFLHTVAQPKLAEQPQNVVVIIGESFGQWPLLPQFRDLQLTPRMAALQAAPNATYVNTMLANGSGTIMAVNGIVSGLPDTGLYENYQPQSMRKPYRTGIGYIFKQLGYKTVFWYGGFSGWQNIKNFVTAQSFDEFHCADEFGETGGNAWGCPDAVLFERIAEYMQARQDGEKRLHVILTTSNHPPYTLDVDAQGFPREQIKSRLTRNISSDKTTLDELGHIWYADKTMGDFIELTEKRLPDSLFVVTGDHSERFSFAVEQDVRTVSTIPCIFYGRGVRNNWFASDAQGSFNQLPATLAELVAPAGFLYSALTSSIFDTERPLVFNHRLCVRQGEPVDISRLQDEALKQYIADVRNVAAWRVLKGDEVP